LSVVEEILCCKFAYETGTGIGTETETETETVDGLRVEQEEDHRIEDQIEDRIEDRIDQVE
jgi:hypothetical protein